MHDTGLYYSSVIYHVDISSLILSHFSTSYLLSLSRFLMRLLERRHALLILKSSIAPVQFFLLTNLGSLSKGHSTMFSSITLTCLEPLAPAVMLAWLLMLSLRSGEQKESFRCRHMKTIWRLSDSLHHLALSLTVTFIMTMIRMRCFAASLP